MIKRSEFQTSFSYYKLPKKDYEEYITIHVSLLTSRQLDCTISTIIHAFVPGDYIRQLVRA